MDHSKLCFYVRYGTRYTMYTINNSTQALPHFFPDSSLFRRFRRNDHHGTPLSPPIKPPSSSTITLIVMSAWYTPENLYHHQQDHQQEHNMSRRSVGGAETDFRPEIVSLLDDALDGADGDGDDDDGQEYAYLGTALGADPNPHHRHEHNNGGINSGDDDDGVPESLKAYVKERDSIIDAERESFFSLVQTDRDDLLPDQSLDDSIETNPSFPDDLMVSPILKKSRSPPSTNSTSTPTEAAAQGDNPEQSPHRTPTPKLSNVFASPHPRPSSSSASSPSSSHQQYAQAVSPSPGIIDLTGLPDSAATAPVAFLGSSPAQPIAVDAVDDNAAIGADAAPTNGVLLTNSRGESKSLRLVRADGSSPMAPIPVDVATIAPARGKRPPRRPASTPGSRTSSASTSNSNESATAKQKAVPPLPPRLPVPSPTTTTKKRSRISPAPTPPPPAPSATKALSILSPSPAPSAEVSPTTAFFASLTDRLSRPTASSSIRSESKKSTNPKSSSPPKSFHEANKERESSRSPDKKNGGAAKGGSSPAAETDSSQLQTTSAAGGDETSLRPSSTLSGSSQKREPKRKAQLKIDTGEDSTSDSHQHQHTSRSPVASAIEASRRVAPQISSPTDSPDFLNRLTQHTAASQARVSSGGIQARPPTSPPSGEGAGGVPSLRRLAASCESCSTNSPPKRVQETLSPTHTSPSSVKVIDPSSRLMSETASSKAHHRSPPKESDGGEPANGHSQSSQDKATSNPSSPVKVSEPSSRLLSDTAASKAHHSRAPPIEVLTVPSSVGKCLEPSDRLTRDTASSFAHHRSETNEQVPPSPAVASTPSPALLDRLTKETAASAARRLQEELDSAGKTASPPHLLHFRYNLDAPEAFGSPPSLQHGHEVSISPSASVFSRLAQDTESSKARKVASPSKRAGHPGSGAHGQKESTSVSSVLPSGADPSQTKRVALTSTGDDDDEKSFDIPNVCSSLTQDSAVSSTELARLWEARELAKRVATVRPVPSQSRLLQGTASSRSRVGAPGQQVPIDDSKRKGDASVSDSSRFVSSTASSSQAAERARQATTRANGGKENRTGAVVKRPVTVPVTPTFMRKPRTKQPVPMTTLPEATLAQSTDTLRKTLRGDFKSSIIAKHSSSVARKPTIPKTPNFATSKRQSRSGAVTRREAEPTLAQSTDVLKRGLRSDASLSSTSDLSSRRRQPTIPKTPQFATTQRHGPKSTVAKESRYVDSLANSTAYLRAGLRTPYVSGRTQFPATSTRTKESAPAGTTATRSSQSTAVSRTVTKPVPFRFQTDTRLHTESRTKSVALSTRDARDLEEMNKQFRARPAPAHSSRPSMGGFQARSYRQVGAKLEISPNDSSAAAVPSASPLSPLTPTSDDEWTVKAARRQELAESARKNVRAMALQREQELKERQRETIRQGNLRSEAKRLPVQANAKPFTLQSELRGEQHQRRFQEKLQRESEEQRRLSSFHAREYSANPTPSAGARSSRRSDRFVTQAQPFQLHCVERHQLYEIERRQQLAAEDEDRRRRLQFKAKPVPHSTYASPVATPSPGAGHRPMSSPSAGSSSASAARRAGRPSR
jgi:hypothetical protein